MQKKNSLFRIIMPLLMVGIVAWYFSARNDTPHNNKAQPAALSASQKFDRDSLPLQYSTHARCRMDCRDITENEIEEIRKTGRVNLAKSELDNKRCPRWALEGNSADGQELRIIFAQCAAEVVVVTAIDTGENHSCNCN